MKELLEAYGWEEILSKNPYMISFMKEDKRMNCYHTGTIQIQSSKGQQKIYRSIDTVEKLEKILNK